jgi:DNA ligase-1
VKSSKRPKVRSRKAVFSSSDEDEENITKASDIKTEEESPKSAKENDVPNEPVKNKKKFKVVLNPKGKDASQENIEEEVKAEEEAEEELTKKKRKKAEPKAKAKKAKTSPKAKKSKANPKEDPEKEEDEEKGSAKEDSPKREQSPEKKNDSPKKEKSPAKNEEKSPAQIKEKKNTMAAFFGLSSSKPAQNQDSGKRDYEAVLKQSRYDPIEDAIWKKGDKTPYLAFAKTLKAIESTSGRLKTIEILANYLRSVMVLSPNDLLASVYLCLNKLAPAYEGIELGIGDQMLTKVIAQTTGRSMQQIKADASKMGDLGIVAESSRGSQRTMFQPAPLTVPQVFDKLKEIANMSGQSVNNHKVTIIHAFCKLVHETNVKNLKF